MLCLYFCFEIFIIHMRLNTFDFVVRYLFFLGMYRGQKKEYLLF